MLRPAFGLCVCLLAMVSTTRADDWPQWMGPGRDGIWQETGIIREFPQDGLPVAWRAEVGLGYSGPAVAAGRVYVMDYLLESGEITNNSGARDKLTGQERVLCFDAKDGTLLWKHAYARDYNLSFPGGPRCTPTVFADKVYALGAEGNLWCLDAKKGQVIWSVDFVKDYGVTVSTWGVAAHPLVVDDTVYCVVGGEGSVAVAFDRLTGKEKWRALTSTESGYCPPTLIEQAGVKQLLIWDAKALNSLNPQTGAVYWSVELEPRYGMAIAAPRQWKDQLLASNFGVAALLKLGTDKPAAEVLWQGKPKNAVYSANATPIIEDGIAYGCDIDTGALMAVRLNDGERLWQTMQATTGSARRDAYGTAFLVKNDDVFFLFNELGDLILAKLTPQGYQEIARSHLLDPTNTAFGRPVLWSPPAYANRCLFARNDKELICVRLGEK